MLIRVVDSTLVTRPLKTRLPFKFGVQVLTEVSIAELAVTIQTSGGERFVGHASDLLIPKWFKKDPSSTSEEDADALKASIEAAASLLKQFGEHVGGHPVFDIWLTAYRELVESRDAADQLVAGFGVSMVERAMIDATCLALQCSFAGALLSGELGFQSERLLPETKGWNPRSLPAPSDSINVRHTIGMLDPLEHASIPAEELVDDGLPQALDENIDLYGLEWFKIKICGDPEHDRPRLKAIANVVMPRVGNDARFTLDGNEQCLDMPAVAGMLRDLQSDDVAGALVERIALIEQPLPRALTFDKDANQALSALSAIAPVIIDEADAAIDSFREAISLGYAGVSIKACKGVFRALANRALLDLRDDARLLQSGEDLTNLGSIALQQDLALQVALGIKHVERNGHHYFRGLPHLSHEACAFLIRKVSDVWVPLEETATLNIHEGKLRVSNFTQQPGFGGVYASIE